MPKYVSNAGDWKQVPNKPVEITIEDKPVTIKIKKIVELDINNDGVFDKKDASLASKVLSETKKRKYTRKKKK